MNLSSDLSFIDLHFLGNPGVIGTGVVRTGSGAWLVDPGPTSALPALKSGLAALGLSPGDVRGLLLTHVHLDHAGASGTIVHDSPDRPVFVHERGAPHVIDPSRLLQSAERLYGGSLDRLWGEVAGVPAANVKPLKGGEVLDLDGRAVHVAYTPGHASHHVSYFDSRSRAAFVGDTGGVRLAPVGHVVPPTPPPDIDLDAWKGSIARIGDWEPQTLYVTHFGAVPDPAAHLATLQHQLWAYAEMVRTSLQEDGSDEDRTRRFTDRVTAILVRAMPEEEAARYRMAVSLEHCWLGLARYWRKKAQAKGDHRLQS